MRADRVRRRGGAGRRARQRRQGQVGKRPRPTSIRPRRRWPRFTTIRQGQTRVTGPIAFAIDGKDETAWGTDAGPGRRNQPRKAVFVAETPIANPAGTMLTFSLVAEAWRLEQRRQPEQQPGPFPLLGHRRAPTPWPIRCRKAVARHSGDPGRADARRRQIEAAVQLLANDGARVARGECPDRGAVERSIPAGASQLGCWPRATSRATTHMLKRGDFLKPDQAVTPGVPGFLHPLPRRAADSADVCPLAGRPPFADHGPVDRQSGLAGVLRHRLVEHERRSRHAERAAVASRSCSTGWPSNSWTAAGA